MKLKPINVFILLIGLLILSSFLGRRVYEGVTDMTTTDTIDHTDSVQNTYSVTNGNDTVTSNGDGSGNDTVTSTDKNKQQSTTINIDTDVMNMLSKLFQNNNSTKPDTNNRRKYAIKNKNSYVENTYYQDKIPDNRREYANKNKDSYLENAYYQDKMPDKYGVYKTQIPRGDEDLYILKSQIVPPVCPACPANISCGSKEPPPPCPACARCPEPAFDCKKIPNYRSSNSDYLPRPVLTDFSSFGM